MDSSLTETVCANEQHGSVAICENASQWDAYVANADGASNYHRWVWRDIIQSTYGHRPYYLVSKNSAGTIDGILPLIFMRSRLFGNFLVSMPFFSYGGVVADTAAAEARLLAHATKLAWALGARDIEIRQGDPLVTNWVGRTPKVSMIKNLPSSLGALWASLTSRMRNKISHARKHGLELEWAGKGAVGTLYKVFSRNMRDLGTPTYPQSWFENMCGYCPEGTRILILWDKREPVAAGIITAYRDTVELPWCGSTPESRKNYSSVLLYWNAMEWAQKNGFRRFDLGRCTKGGGTYEFKRHFGCEERVLHWYYWLAPGVRVPQLRPDNPKFRLATRVWRKLPVGIANFMGPMIVRAIP